MSRAKNVRITRYHLGWDSLGGRLPDPARITPSIRDLLREPTWSVRSLLPPKPSRPSDGSDGLSTKSPVSKGEITREKLHHLLRLSALPIPQDPRKEDQLLASLERHLHFVRTIQNVDTRKPPTWESPVVHADNPVASKIWNPDPNANNGEVEPLVAIRDETFEAISENTVRLEDLLPTLAKEEKRGMNKTVRRRWKVNTDWEDGDAAQNNEVHAPSPATNDEDSKNSNEEDNQKDVANEVSKHKQEALAEKKRWWIDVDRIGSGNDIRKKGKYFFVRRKKKAIETKKDSLPSTSHSEAQSQSSPEE